MYPIKWTRKKTLYTHNPDFRTLIFAFISKDFWVYMAEPEIRTHNIPTFRFRFIDDVI